VQNSFKLYKNPRGRFISLELIKDTDHYGAYFIGHQGQHSFISFVDEKNIPEYIEKLCLIEADDVEQAKAALYRINNDLNLDMRENENLFNW